MEFNILPLFLAAFSTLLIGAIWYNPKVFGNIWMRETGVTMQKMSGAKMAATYLGALVYAFFIALVLRFLVIHQTGAVGMVGGNPALAKPSYTAFMEDYGTAFRTFKHGALHGTIAGLFFALPVIGVGALFEGRSWKYVLIAGGYWVVTAAIMGGIICAMS